MEEIEDKKHSVQTTLEVWVPLWTQLLLNEEMACSWDEGHPEEKKALLIDYCKSLVQIRTFDLFFFTSNIQFYM